MRKLGDDISADDDIIQYSQVPDLGTFEIPALKAMCFATLRADFPQKACPGDIIIAGRSGAAIHSRPFAPEMIEVWRAGSLADAMLARE